MDKPEKNSRFHFDIHASVVLQLGDTLISDVAQALVELVKNSYDADASYAKVIIDTEGKPGEQSLYPDALGYISIEDDGVGMDQAPELYTSEGFGLSSMRQRAGAIGGEWQIESRPGAGTRVSVRMAKRRP